MKKQFLAGCLCIIMMLAGCTTLTGTNLQTKAPPDATPVLSESQSTGTQSTESTEDAQSTSLEETTEITNEPEIQKVTITAVGGWLLSAARIWAVSSSPSDRINSFTSHSGWE